MKARLVLHEKRVVAGGGALGVAELKIWDVRGVRGQPAQPRFRLFFVVNGNVVVGFDNHQPKGPHLHFGGQEVPYEFTTIDRLVEDFWDLVRKAGFAP